MKAALVYAKRLGWRVLPVRPGGKIPAISDWTNAASNDPEQVARWIEEFPDANIGVACGAGSGVFVLDVDPRNGGRPLEDNDLPHTPTAQTPSGGWHYVFKHVPGLRNSAQALGAGLDIRAEGGQFVVAPSRTQVGAYRWIIPPWECEPADAPAWLLERLSLRPEPTDSAPATDRGFFPSASPAVLEAARDALDRHGPAVEGRGGDEHTFKACALLVHDFALTDDESWPLLAEWNSTCEPPWSEADLRAKLRGGGKYGSRPYGCKRAADCLEAAKRIIAEWQTAGAPEAGIVPMLKRIRKLPIADPAEVSAIERELTAATGLKSRALALPKPVKPVERPPDEIEVNPRLHEVADQAVAAFAPVVFQRNGVLCEVVKADRQTFISDLAPARILDLMSRHGKFYRVDKEAGVVSQPPPPPVAQILHARRSFPNVRPLEAVTTAPVFLADGTILQDRGYNRQARVFLEPSVSVEVPDEPTHDDARRAVRRFRDLLCDFQFRSSADFSSWVAGLLTPLVKSALDNAPAPLFCVSASSAGAGKSLLTDAIAMIVTGAKAEMRSYKPKDPAEWSKSLTAFVRSAAPISVLDNCNGPVGDESLDRLITSSTWSDRILGASDAIPLPNVSTWFATGNNIEPIGDTVRRVLMIRIEVDTERPQERTGFRYDLEGGYASSQRSELLGAALTVLRGFHVAGRPSQGLPSWGSFTAWSSLVRNALVWSGLEDPFLTQRRAAAELNQGENDAHDFWLAVVAESDGSAAEITSLANQRDASTVLGLREFVTVRSLARLLGRFVDKPRSGKRVRRDAGRYRVEPVTR